MALIFEYCECGCKGYQASAAGQHYWIFWDLRGRTKTGGPYFLRRGHSWSGTPMGSFPSQEAAEKAAFEEVESAKLFDTYPEV